MSNKEKKTTLESIILFFMSTCFSQGEKKQDEDTIILVCSNRGNLLDCYFNNLKQYR